MKNKKCISLFITLALGLNSTLFAIPSSQANYDPFQRTFIVTAYYSPLPGQEFYVTGSLERDKRLNGNGTNGADGTPVYNGMIAAPGTYAFGTRINCPGIIDGEIHDRGGAIVKAGVRSNAYDRLDFWAGHGDEGLKKALFWGKRTLTCTMYPPGYSEFEQYADLPIGNLNNLAARFLKKPTTNTSSSSNFNPNYIAPRYRNLLSDLGYDPDDIASRIAFQLRHDIITSAEESSAGNVGPKTRAKLEAIYIDVANNTPREKLQEGAINNDVRILQTVLHELGYLNVEDTAIFGAQTKAALIQFQIQLNQKTLIKKQS